MNVQIVTGENNETVCQLLGHLSENVKLVIVNAIESNTISSEHITIALQKEVSEIKEFKYVLTKPEKTYPKHPRTKMIKKSGSKYF